MTSFSHRVSIGIQGASGTPRAEAPLGLIGRSASRAGGQIRRRSSQMIEALPNRSSVRLTKRQEEICGCLARGWTDKVMMGLGKVLSMTASIVRPAEPSSRSAEGIGSKPIPKNPWRYAWVIPSSTQTVLGNFWRSSCSSLNIDLGISNQVNNRNGRKSRNRICIAPELPCLESLTACDPGLLEMGNCRLHRFLFAHSV